MHAKRTADYFITYCFIYSSLQFYQQQQRTYALPIHFLRIDGLHHRDRRNKTRQKIQWHTCFSRWSWRFISQLLRNIPVNLYLRRNYMLTGLRIVLGLFTLLILSLCTYIQITDHFSLLPYVQFILSCFFILVGINEIISGRKSMSIPFFFVSILTLFALISNYLRYVQNEILSNFAFTST